MQRTPTCQNCCKSYGFKDVSKPIGNRIPLLLECGHTFCEGCITKWARLQKTQVLCPECTYSTPLTIEGEKGVRNIPANIYLLGVMTNTKRASFRSDVQKTGRSKLGTKAGLQRAISQFAQEKKAEMMKNDSGVKCEECCRTTATSSCNKCETVYCTACFERVHSYSNALRKHTPMPVTQASSDTAVGCPDHNNRPLEFYDKDAGQPVCSHCVVIGERQTHAIVPIDDIAKEVQDQFKASIDEVSTIVTHLDKSVQKICGALPEVKAEKNNIVNDIREQFQILYAALQTREHSLIKDVELNHNGEKMLEKLREEVTDSLRKAKNYIQELETLIGQPQKLIDNTKKLKNELESFQEMPCCAVAVPSGQDEVKFVAGTELCNNISEYGLVSMDGCERFELKKISEMTEEELRKDNDNTEHEVTEAASEDQRQEDENTVPSDEMVQHAGTARTITASKILKASLAYRHELVLVTHIRDPCQFMIQRVADMEQLQLMMNVINIYCDSTENVHDLLYDVKFGDMCCAQFATDNQWYRACIKTAYSPAHPNVVPTLENGLCVEVQYIDYGNSEWVPLSRLRKMKSEFLNVPELAQCCTLADIVPPFQEDKWPLKATKAFGSLTGDKPLLMTVIEKKGSKLVVDLRRPEDEEPTQDDDRPVSVRDALVFLEVARFSSPASKPEGIFFPKKTYKEPVPIGKGAFVDVLVTYVVSPDEIFVQKLRSEETVELQHIMEEITKMFGGRRRGTEWSVPWPYKGLVCAARFTEDRVWYRALVTAVNSDETVSVNYVDFGNSENLPFSDIKKLPDMFLRLPKQALLVCLVDIKPNGDEAEWQRQDQDNAISLLLNRSLVVDVKGVVDDKMSVLLYDTTGSQDVCINEFLVLNGYCQSAGLGYIKKMKEIREKIETGKLNRKRSMHRTLACSFKRSCSLVKSRDELTAKQENTEESTAESTTENTVENSAENSEEQSQQGDTVETDSLQGNFTGSEIQGDQSSQCSSFTEEEKAVCEEKVVLHEASVMPASYVAYHEFQYKPAPVPEWNRFQAGVTFVDPQGYIYAQEVKEGDRTLINIMGSLLERYGKGDDKSTAPPDATSVSPGLPCCAQFTEDGMWYRARVVKFVEEDKVQVNYIDFGNSEVVPLSVIRQEMPFMEVPQQCLQLVLRGVEPKTSDGHWPANVIGALSQAVVGQDCVATIKGDKLPGYPLVVRLFLPDGSDVAHNLLSRGLVQKSILLEGEEERQFYPRKRGPGKAKPGKSARSITETRAHAQMISSREVESMLAHTELPGNNIRFDVTITHLERPDCLFIQRVPPTDNDQGFSDDPDPTLEGASDELQELEDIMAKINEPDYFKKYTPLTTASEGMLCCARYTEDDMWYRAQIKSVESKNPLEVRVVYVDYGTTEVIKADRTRGFPSELLELPIQSTRCFLADVRPPDTTDRPMMEDGCWPVNTMEALIQLVAGKKLVAKTLFNGPPASVILYEHKTRSDGCTEEVSIGFLLAQKGLVKCSDYENEKNEESDIDDRESCESERTVLEFKESELSFKLVASETRTESKSSSSADLLEKILAPNVGFAPALANKPPQPLTPSALSTKSEDQSSKNCDLEKAGTELGSSVMNSENGSKQQTTQITTTTEEQSRDETNDKEPTSSEAVSPDHVTEVTSAVTDSSVTEVNPDSLESSV